MLDSIIKFSIRNKLIIGMMTIVLVIWGIWSATKLPIDAVPDITNNQVQIITVCPTLAGQEVEQLVTFPIEQAIANLPNLEETRSISRFGLSTITVVFREDVDIYFARQLISERLKEAEEDIPKGIGRPELAPVSTGLGEVYQYILHPKKGSESKYTASDLRTMQDWIVARQIYGTEGVAEVNSFGGALKQYEVAVDPNRLKAMGVSVSDIFNALEKNNQNTGGAYIDKKPNAYFIRGIGLVTTLEDIRNIAVKDETGSVPIFIKDVADVRFGSAIRYGAMTYNGEKDAVGGVIMMLKGANSNEVVNSIKAKIPGIQKSLPDDVVIEPFLDRTDLVKRAISTVERNLLEGALIVIFVLVLFLGNLRAGLIVASAIPLSLLFALGMMNIFGVSANLMSLGAIDFGLIVDGAVIIVEAILHLMSLEKTKTVLNSEEMDLVVEASAEKMMNSAAFGQIIILIVYLPILSLTGIEGKMFTPMAMTVSFAILGALILSVTYIPMMSSKFLSRKTTHRETLSDRMMKIFQKFYQPLLQRAFRFKYLVVSAAVGLFLISLLAFRTLGGEFIPQLQEGDFAFHCILPQGSSLTQSIETSMHASRIIKQFDEVKMVVGKTGSAEVPTDPMPPEVSDLIILLKPQEEWKEQKSYNKLAEEILEKLESIPGIFFEANQPIQMRFNELMTGIRQDVAVKIFGENMDTLLTYAEQSARVIQQISGVTTPQIEKVSGLPEINVEYDRTRLANYGLNVEDVNDILSTAFAGRVAGQVYEDERRFDLVVRLDTPFRKNIDDVNSLMVPIRGGAQIPLSQIARVSYKLGPAQISRESGKRRIVVGFNVSGRDVESVVSDIQEKLEQQVHLPSGYYFTYGGQFENLQQASKRLLVAVPISLLLIFILLYFTFHSLKQAVLIYTAIPMSAIGGVFALLIRGMPFSISAGIGFIALFGVAVLNGIVLIGTFNQLEKDGIRDLYQRVMEGTRSRLRPVLMTATVASLGFLPMAVSHGAGAEVQKPLATVVIGGLVTATILTLLVLPLLYIIFNTKIKRRMKPDGIVAFVAMLLMSFSSQAQTLVIDNADQAVEWAIKNNPGLRAKNLETLAAHSLIRTSGELPKMDLGIQLGQYSSIRFDNAFSVSQNIPFPTVFKAKREFAESVEAGKDIQAKVSINELRHSVRKMYHSIQCFINIERQLMYLDSLYLEFTEVAKLRHKTGDTKMVDVSTAETKRGEIDLKIKQNTVNMSNAYHNLRVLLNVRDSIRILPEEDYSPLTLSLYTDTLELAHHPTIMAYYLESLILEKSKAVEKAQGLPEFTVGYTNQSLIGNQIIDGKEHFFGAGKRYGYYTAGIAIPLTFGATKARIQSIEYSRAASEANAIQQQNDLQAQLQSLIRQYEHCLLQYKHYNEKALPNAGEIVRAARLGYRTGDISYMEYLYALQTAADVRFNYIESICQLNQIIIEIYRLLNQ